MPRSISGQGPYYSEAFPSHIPQPLPNADTLHVRSKDPRDHYDPYKPIMEP
jgi:hypothetical protein